MRLRQPLAFAIALLVAPTARTLQAQIIDQSNLGQICCFGDIYAWQGETFTPTANTSGGAGFELYNESNALDRAGSIMIELWDRQASLAGATMLASGTVNYTLPNQGSQGMFDAFWAPVAVTPGNQYYLTFIGQDPGQDDNITSTFSPTGNFNGEAYYTYSPSDPTVPPLCCGSQYDLGFEEYSTSTVSSAPEPATLVLVGSGLVGVFGVARRRRKIV